MFNDKPHKLLYICPEIEFETFYPDLICTSGDIEGYDKGDDYVWP